MVKYNTSALQIYHFGAIVSNRIISSTMWIYTFILSLIRYIREGILNTPHDFS